MPSKFNWRTLVAASFLVVGSSSGALAQNANADATNKVFQDIGRKWDCENGKTSQVVLAACTKVLSETGYSSDDRSTFFNARGAANIAVGHADQAIADFSSALAINSNNASALRNLGTCQVMRSEFLQGHGDQNGSLRLMRLAYENFDKALSINPNDAEALDGRATVELLLGSATNDAAMTAQSQADRQRVRQIDPNH